MKIYKSVSLLLGASLAVFISGCSARMGSMSVLSTEHISNLDVKKDHKKVVTGESCERNYFLLFPTGDMQNKVELATERAIESGHKQGLEGNVLIDAKMDMKVTEYLLYSKYCVVVTGQLDTLRLK